MKIIAGLPRAARKGEWVSLDIELFKADEKRLHRPTGSFACLSIAFEDGTVYQIYDQHDLREAVKRIAPGRWVFMNALFDIFHLRRWVPIKQRPVWDVMLVEQDLFGGWYEDFSLAALARRWLHSHLDKKTVEEFTIRDTMTAGMKQYGATDALMALKVREAQDKYLHSIEDDLVCYTKVDEPALWAILDMAPIRVDVDGWLKIAEQVQQKAEALRNTLGFNPGSPKQVQDAIYAVAGRRASYRRKETTSATALELMLEDAQKSQQTRLADLLTTVLDYRRYAKAASTYGPSWIEQYVEEDGLVYPNWHVTGALTGRMSCSRPNMQQIPIREMPEYRQQFIAQKGGRILSADLSQQEPRITAWMTQDKALLAAVKTGDVYLPIARALNVTRDRAKPIFLGTTYGLTPQGLADREKIPLSEAQGLFEDFFFKYPGIPRWMEKERRKARSLGYVTTPMGRRAWVNVYDEQYLNNAINSPIQGGAADQTKLALSIIRREAAVAGLPYCVNIVIHDEVCCDVPTGDVPTYRRIVKEAWQESGEMVIPGVPTAVDMKVGRSWGG